MIRFVSPYSRGRSSLGHVEIMAATTDTPSVFAPEWETDVVHLKDFSSKKYVPSLAKVVKGSYMNIGHSKFSIHRQHTDVFVHSIKMGVKVLAHSVRRVEATTRRGLPCTRLVALDQRLSIPIAYQGWFELLSEDGKSARPISSVHELAKVFPEKCLVRENVKGYLATADGKFTFDKTRVVPAGEQLTLCGDISLPSPSQNTKIKLLRCTDSKGENVYLSFDQKGMFTPIAGPDDFTGVLTIRDIIRRFRLPLTVKLLQGVKPKVDTAQFTGLIRLDWVYTDETAFVCPLEKNHVRMLPVPTDTHLQLSAASNNKTIKQSESYKSMLMKCNRMVSNYNNTIHLIVTLPESVLKSKNRASSNIFSKPQRFNVETHSSMRRSKSKEDLLMEEIDDLYQFVRDGGSPPKSKFTYDSDEESYWEEPAYEPIDDFRARLMALEAGKKVTHHDKYKPADLAKISLDADGDMATGVGNLYGVMANGSPKLSSSPPGPPPLPPRPSSGSNNENETKKEVLESTPPPLPPRQYQRSDSAPIFPAASPGMITQTNEPQAKTVTSSKKNKASMKKSKSKDSVGKDSSSGSGGGRNNFARDFRDSDISSRTKGSSGSSGPGVIKKRMQTMYL